jgi:hypothetical protein
MAARRRGATSLPVHDYFYRDDSNALGVIGRHTNENSNAWHLLFCDSIIAIVRVAEDDSVSTM